MANKIVQHEFNGNPIRQRVSDDYVSLTDMAKAGGKLIADYLRLESTKAYIQALSDAMGIPIGDLIVNKPGSRTGTMAHPEIAMDCAQWVSLPLRIWANRTLVRVVREQAQPQPETVTLPPADVRITNFVGALEKLGIDLDNPRFSQELKDFTMDIVLGKNKTLPSSNEVWAGVAEIAERMGYAIALVTKYRSPLGRWVAVCDGLEKRIEKRLCNGTSRDVNLYLDCEDLRSSVSEFMDAKVLAN